MSRPAIFVAGVLASIAAYAFFVEPGLLRLARVAVELPAEHAELDGLRILEAGDLHFRSGRNEAKVLALAERLKPDLIVLAGDMVEEEEVKEEALRFVEALPKGIPVYAVFGNWEHWSGIDLKDWTAQLESRGVKVLTNACSEVVISGKRIVLAGVDDIVTRHANLDRTLSTCPAGYRVLISHAPAIIEKSRSSEFSLILAAHCHGGQIRMPFGSPVFLPRGCKEDYYYGLIQRPSVTMYVTAGVGTSIIPARFLARPEIALIELIRKK